MNHINSFINLFGEDGYRSIVEYLQANGATSDNENQAWKEFLSINGFEQEHLLDAYKAWLEGMTIGSRSILDMEAYAGDNDSLGTALIYHYFGTDGTRNADNMVVYDKTVPLGTQEALAGSVYQGNGVNTDLGAASVTITKTGNVQTLGIRFYTANVLDKNTSRTPLIGTKEGTFEGIYFGNSSGSITNEIISILWAGNQRVAWTSSSLSIAVGWHDLVIQWNDGDGDEDEQTYDIFLDDVQVNNFKTTGADKPIQLVYDNVTLLRAFTLFFVSADWLRIADFIMTDQVLTSDQITNYHNGQIKQIQSSIDNYFPLEMDSEDYTIDVFGGIVADLINFTSSEIVEDNGRVTSWFNKYGWLNANGVSHYANDDQTGLFDAGQKVPARDSTNSWAYDSSGEPVPLNNVGKAAYNGTASIDLGTDYIGFLTNDFTVTLPSTPRTNSLEFQVLSYLMEQNSTQTYTHNDLGIAISEQLNRIPSYREAYRAQTANVMILYLGDSVLARETHTSVLNIDPETSPPMIITDNLFAKMYTAANAEEDGVSLGMQQGSYFKYYSARFTYSGTWANSQSDALWDDAGTRPCWTRYSNDDDAYVEVTLATGADESGFDLIHRTDSTGATCLITIAEGNGVVEAYISAAWVEANAATFTMLQGDLSNGNTQYQKTISFRKVSDETNPTIRIDNNEATSKRMMIVAGRTYDKSQFYLNQVNVARGGESLVELSAFFERDVFSYNPDLIMLEIPLINMIADTPTVTACVNEFIDYVYGDRVGNLNPDAIDQRLTTEFLFVIPQYIQSNFVTDSDTFKDLGSGDTAEDIYEAVVAEIESRTGAYINLSASQLTAIDNNPNYANYYEGMAANSITEGYTTDGIHANDVLTEVFNPKLSPFLTRSNMYASDAEPYDFDHIGIYRTRDSV